jgi:cytochrome c-type biogenesis protein CcmH
MLFVFILSKIAVVLAVLLRFVKIERGPMFIIAAAFALGLAGYATQGQPGLPQSLAKPVDQNETRVAADAAFAAAKKALSAEPGSAQRWMNTANALMARNNGILVPAAEYAYGKALSFDPKHMQSLYFYGLALSQAGRAEPARAAWKRLASLIPTDEPKRNALLAGLVSTGIISKQDIDAVLSTPKTP